MGSLLAPLIVALAVGCSPEEAPAPAAPAPEAVPAPESSPAPPQGVGGLDTRGNLRPSPDVIHGFALPLASAVLRRNPPVVEVYAESNIERLLRFYRSRGHVLTRTRTGWEIRHTPRTLRDQGIEGVTLAGALLTMRQGPGAGWTFRLESGKPQVLRRPALTELMEAEKRYREQAAREDNDDKNASASKKRAERPDLKELKRRAFNRPMDKRRVRDLSRQIYEYNQQHPDEEFID